MTSMLDDLKLTLDVTWQDDETDKKLQRLLDRSIFEINEYAGEPVNYDKDLFARQLVLDLARYIWNNVKEEFKDNFGQELIQIRTRYQVKRKNGDSESGTVKYLGHIDSLTELSVTANKGDFYIANAGVQYGMDLYTHQGDMILAECQYPEQMIDGVNWTILHNEPDTNIGDYPATEIDINNIFTS